MFKLNSKHMLEFFSVLPLSWRFNLIIFSESWIFFVFPESLFRTAGGMYFDVSFWKVTKELCYFRNINVQSKMNISYSFDWCVIHIFEGICLWTQILWLAFLILMESVFEKSHCLFSQTEKISIIYL